MRGKAAQNRTASVAAIARTPFGHSRIDPAVYRNKVTGCLSPDPGDQIHAAAAIHGQVDVLVTRNLKHLATEPVIRRKHVRQRPHPNGSFRWVNSGGCFPQKLVVLAQLVDLTAQNS